MTAPKQYRKKVATWLERPNLAGMPNGYWLFVVAFLTIFGGGMLLIALVNGTGEVR